MLERKTICNCGSSARPLLNEIQLTKGYYQVRRVPTTIDIIYWVCLQTHASVQKFIIVSLTFAHEFCDCLMKDLTIQCCINSSKTLFHTKIRCLASHIRSVIQIVLHREYWPQNIDNFFWQTHIFTIKVFYYTVTMIGEMDRLERH